jgi:SAM-dependent methyltransferase
MDDVATSEVLRPEDLYADKGFTYFANARTDIRPLIPQGAQRVLELGCGTGATVRMIRAERDVNYAVGFDLDPGAAIKAEEVFDRVITGNVETMELPNELFNLILALDVLEHLVDPWRMVERLKGILAPGGTIIASIPNVAHYSVCRELLLGRWNYVSQGLMDRTHLRFFTEKTAMELMTPPGLKAQTMIRNVQEPVMIQFRSQRLRWYQRRLTCFCLPKRMTTVQFLIASVRTREAC